MSWGMLDLAKVLLNTVVLGLSRLQACQKISPWNYAKMMSICISKFQHHKGTRVDKNQ